VAVVCGRRRAP